MSIDVNDVRSWFKNASDADADELYDITYHSPGYKLVLESVPEGYAIEIIASENERDYDSYGYSTVDGYVIFEVTDPEGDKQKFKLPAEYASYDGWSIDYDKITAVEKREKVITTWEWQNV